MQIQLDFQRGKCYSNIKNIVTSIRAEVLPQTYLDTDIYKASGEIKKMQKLSSNILTTWYEVDNGRKMIESKKK